MIKLTSTELLFADQPVYRVAKKQDIRKTPAKKVLLVYENDSEQLAAPLKEMLGKLVSACQFQADEAEYLNIRYRYTNTSLGDWKNIFSPQIILVFGNIPLSRNISGLKKNHAYAFDGVQIIVTEAPDKLSSNDKEKGALWGALKRALKI